jgi:dTDP-4-dehydrorhamnose 3,5-epimerase
VIFAPGEIDGVWHIDLEPRRDARGAFARSFCSTEFAAHGLPSAFVQCNISQNTIAGVLRGLHWQMPPHEEGKLVRCTSGAAFDVAVDIRPGSPTRWRWTSVILSAERGNAIYIPPGFAHGFQALLDGTELFYMMTQDYRPESSAGLRWDDPTIAIDWPIRPPLVSERDAGLPLVAA